MGNKQTNAYLHRLCYRFNSDNSSLEFQVSWGKQTEYNIVQDLCTN